MINSGIVFASDIIPDSVAMSQSYTVSNMKFEFSDSTNYFIVLKNDHYCQNCLFSINEYAKKIRNSYGVKFVVISECDSVTLERKRTIAETKNNFSAFDEFLVQYSTNSANSFTKYVTYSTPDILILVHGRVTHIPYHEIFNPLSMNIKNETQLLITMLLND